VAKLSFEAELLFRKLMSVADDYGRFDGEPDLIRARCYPLQLERATELMVAGWLAECCRHNLIRLYLAKDTLYLQLEDFGQRIRTGSRFPNPDGRWLTDDSNLLTNARSLRTNDSNLQADDSRLHTNDSKISGKNATDRNNGSYEFSDSNLRADDRNLRAQTYSYSEEKYLLTKQEAAEAEPPNAASCALTVTSRSGRKKPAKKVKAAVARAPMAAPGAPPPGGKKGNRKQPGRETESGQLPALAAVAGGDHSAAAIANARDVIRSKLGPGATEADIDRKFLESLPRRAI
jgi:hypothetical protein